LKRVIAFIVILSLVVILPHSSAANEVFVGINNIMLPLTDAMPVYSDGIWFIDYHDFTRGDLNMHASYNQDMGTAVLYNWDTTLVFNVGKGTAYKTGGSQYNQRSFFKNGTIYVPAAFVCDQFGIAFSYLSDVSTVRLRTTSSMSDTMFTYIAKNRIPDLISAYNKGKEPEIKPGSSGSPSSSPAPSTPSTTPTPPSSKPTSPSAQNTEKPNTAVDTPNITDETQENDFSDNVVYITINVNNAAKLETIHSILNNYNLPATLFISGAAMENDNLLRRLCSSRHTIGIFANSITEATEANNKLFAIARKKSRLLRSGQALSDAQANGYRQWGANLDTRIRNTSQTNSLLETRSSTVLFFDDSDTSINRLKTILAHINKQKFTVRTIDLMTTPVAP